MNETAYTVVTGMGGLVAVLAALHHRHGGKPSADYQSSVYVSLVAATVYASLSFALAVFLLCFYLTGRHSLTACFPSDAQSIACVLLLVSAGIVWDDDKPTL